MAKVINNIEFKKEVLKSNGVVLVDFFAEWCGPCKMIAPILNELSEEVGQGIKIFKVDVDQSGDLAYEYNVSSVPTMIIFKNGKPVEKTVGFTPKNILKAKLEYYNN